MSVDTTPTSSLRRSPRISSAARSSAASLLTPLLTRTLNYEDIVAGTEEDYEVARVNAGVGDDEDTQQLAVSEVSIVVIYLRLWLNECPGLTNFVSRQLPDEIQVDSMVGPGAAAVAKRQLVSDNSRLRKTPDIIADSINNLAKAC
jgi:hypothetical protein